MRSSWSFARLLRFLPAVTAAAPQDEPEAEHPRTRALVDLVTRADALLEEQGLNAACESFKEPESSWRHGETYVFVLDFAGRMQCHPAQPGLEGRDTLGLTDPDGKPILELILRQLAGGEEDGWAHYLWPHPQTHVHVWKSTYVRRAAAPVGQDYIVGAGAHQLPLERLFVVDRVDEAARLIAERGADAYALLRDPAGGFRFFDAYVFVLDSQGVMLVNPASPELEGKDSLAIRDHEGTHPGRLMLDLLRRQESGWVEYFWPRPGEQEPAFKETFVRRVAVGDDFVVVGAGIYWE